MTNPWHFPREQFAREVIGMFNSGMSHALTFFAPRRKGKTEFLKHDLIPAAEEKAWKTVYYSFMEGEDADKAAGFIGCLQAALGGAGLLSRLGARLKGSLPGIAEAEVSFGAAKEGTARPSISQLIGQLAAQGPTLLLLDEVQELAGREENKVLIAGLRTGLDLHKDKVKVVFTGSSRENLRRMFASSTAPFFHFGANLPFPDLERDFVVHIARVYQLATGRMLAEEALWQAFLQFGRTPAYLREAVEQFVLNPLQPFAEVVAEKLAALPDEHQFDDVWASLTPLERGILRCLAEAPQRVYTVDFRQQMAQMAQLAELPEISTSSMQVAINKLAMRNLIFKNGPRYAVEDEMLRQWVGQMI